MKKIQYQIEVHVYFNHGGLFSTHLEASTSKDLDTEIKKFLEKEKVNPNVEVITFFDRQKITREWTTTRKDVKLKKKITNRYYNNYYGKTK